MNRAVRIALASAMIVTALSFGDHHGAERAGSVVALNPQPEPPGLHFKLNPQPEPPGRR